VAAGTGKEKLKRKRLSMPIDGASGATADYDYSGSEASESNGVSRTCMKPGLCGEPISDITTTSSSDC
jgi:hypothetical protein